MPVSAKFLECFHELVITVHVYEWFKLILVNAAEAEALCQEGEVSLWKCLKDIENRKMKFISVNISYFFLVRSVNNINFYGGLYGKCHKPFPGISVLELKIKKNSYIP